MGKYFGTDGYRGEANVVLTADAAFRVGKFLGWYYSRNKKEGEETRIVMGKDTRLSSYMFEYALAAGITSTGADCYLMHVTTTPSVSYEARTEDFDCGVMISASHNPYYDNGIKVINGAGEKLSDDIIEKIEAYLDGKMGELPLATGTKIGRTVDFAAGRNRYMGYLIATETRSFRGRRIAIDCSNGSASSVAKSVFDALGADTHVINNTPNGTNINDRCGSTHIEALQHYVIAEGCEVGFAFDGDADRCLAVDENGCLVNGDQIMYVCGRFLNERGQLHKNTIVTTVMSNLGLYKALDRAGIRYEKTAVGDRYVYENMSANHFSLGGEQSGHIIFSRHATTGDGILTALKIMEACIEQGKSLKELAEDCVMYPQVLENVRVTDKEAAQKDEEVLAAVRAAEQALGDDGRILVRASGTEPLVRVMVEAVNEETCQKYVDSVVRVIQSRGFAEEERPML